MHKLMQGQHIIIMFYGAQRNVKDEDDQNV